MAMHTLPAAEQSGNGITIVQSQTLVAARPVAVSPKNSVELFGVDGDALPKFLRKLGVPATMTPAGPVALVADVEDAMRARGRPLETRRRAPKAQDEQDDADDDAALLAAAGIILAPSKGRR